MLDSNMLDSNWFLQQVAAQGRYISGVPCSYVAGLYSTLERGGWPYLPATSEGEGVAIAAGTWLGGRQGVVLCQNSGLGNMVNPLTSLISAFRIPIILGVSRRGWPLGTDEPQHELMGAITTQLLELMDLHVDMLPADPVASASLLAQAAERAAARRSTGLIIDKGVFSGQTGSPGPQPVRASLPPADGVRVERLQGGRPVTRNDVLSAYLELAGTQLTITTTGYTGRELYALDDRDTHFYMTGSMGCAPAIGLGVSTATERPVCVIDGDGALLMRMGSLVSVACHVRAPFVHLLLDNSAYESTGGQATNGASVDFASVALASGYRKAWSVEGMDAMRTALRAALDSGESPVMVHCRISKGVPDSLPRPRETLPDLALRFRTRAEVLARTAGG
jgi:phosphonopyruvate decarboxylase